MSAALATEAASAVEAVVRESYGRLVAYLASITGDIADAEDALSDALAAALRSWPDRGVPARPDSWLITVARRNIIGTSRHRRVADRAMPMVHVLHAGEVDVASDAATIPDRRLQLMFACAHPAIDPSMRSPLMLQTVLGLDAARIATAFVVPSATMGQRLVRVKSKIKDAAIPFAIPEAAELSSRTTAVLDAVYAAFGSGWDDPTGADRTRAGLTVEAIRLARLLVELLPDQPEVHGLLALMLHSNARSAARRTADGRFVALEHHDVAAWSADEMREAELHLAIALEANRVGPYQLKAAIQSVHNRRAVSGRTEWGAVASLYDGLVQLEPTLGCFVARAAAWAEAHGPLAALDLLDELPADRADRYQPYHAVRAHCLQRLGDVAGAQAHARRAIELSDDVGVRAFLTERYFDGVISARGSR